MKWVIVILLSSSYYYYYLLIRSNTWFFFIFLLFQLEICADDEVLEASSCKNTTQVASSIGGPAVEVSERNKVSLAEELDNLMDISIEIASNKRMKKDHLKSFRLTFIDKDIQKKVSFLHDAEKHELNPMFSFTSV